MATPPATSDDDPGRQPEPPRLQPGDRVEVRNRFDGRWARGFEVIGHTPGGYRVRRLSGGDELPTTFDEEDVRRERRRSTWWY